MTTRWRIHVGAHKTATTHLQELLEGNDARLLAAGVDVLPTARVAPIVRRGTRKRRRGLKKFFKRLVTGTAPSRADQLRGIMRGMPTTVLSHEDQLGLSQDLLRPALYDGSERLETLAELPDAQEVEIFLSIRSFDTLLVSAYCEFLKPFHDARARLEQRRRTLRDTPPSWFALAERLADRFPQAKLRVWTFEDYVPQPGFVVRALTGVELDDLDNRPAPSRTRAPSPRAIALAEGLDPGLGVRERMQRVQELYMAHPKQAGESLDLFSAEEVDWLRGCYANDLEKIRRSARMELLQP